MIPPIIKHQLTWRIEARATQFSPWFVLGSASTLEDAIASAARHKKNQRLTSTRIRAN